MRTFIKLLSFSLLCCLFGVVAGCGGGSGSNSAASGTIVVGASAGALQITNSSLQLSGTTAVSATFTRADGSPAVGVPVTFATTLGTISPTSGIITNSSGTATVTLNAGITSGQGQITASATVDNRQVTRSALFSVVLPPLHLANLTLTNNDPGNISFGGTQAISVDVLDENNQLYTAQAVDVVFNSTLSQQGKSTINSPVQTVAGKATTTYTAVTATGTDTITASIGGSSLTKSLNIIPPSAGSISFVSATPSTIGLKGSGVQTSVVTFKVSDTSGAPKPNQAVNFALDTTVGGITPATATGSTDQNGLVSITVHSGIIATPVTVTASTTVGTTVLSTQSKELVISTGVPAQDGFSISRVNSNPEAYNIDGVTTVVTARLSDHFHNPVPDGTAVYFTTSGGSIGSFCQTVNGACSVTWTSQDPRPDSVVDSQGNVTHNAGRAVVLAYAIGEEKFIDINGNGLADAGEFTDTSEAFRDDNENGQRDAGETFIDFNGDGAFNLPDGKFNGVGQGSTSVGAPKSKHVFSNTAIVMSTSAAKVGFTKLDDNGDEVSLASITGPGSFFVTVSDLNGNTLASGTTVTVTAPFGTLTGLSSFTVPLNIGFGVTLPLDLAASTTPANKSGLLTVTVRSPSGLTTTRTLSVSGSF